MSLVGLRCLLVDETTRVHATVIRASSGPLQRSSDFTNTRVLLEYIDSPRPHMEWTLLPAADRYTAVFIEDQLVWARRILPSESNSVAWPAKAYSLLFGVLPHTTILVEYFCDQERTYLQLSDTKQLNIIEAKKTLAQHLQMMQELTEAEKKQRDRDILFYGHHNLCHQYVSVFNTQHSLPNWYNGSVSEHNQHTKELTVMEERSGMVRKVNPLLVEVRISSKNSQPGMVSSTTGGWYNSPVNSPQLQAHNHYYGSNSSLANINPAIMQSDPNLNTHPMPGQQYDGCTSGYNTPVGSYTNLHQVQSPLLDPLLEPLRRNERSVSLGNIRLMTQRDSCKRRSSLQAPLLQNKRARFADQLPSIPQENDDFFAPPPGALSRAVSTPVLCNSQQHRDMQEEDELDLIHSIISRETSLEGSPPATDMMRSQSLSHIPSQLGSLPSLHHASSLHMLRENYVSTPDFSATGLGSPPPYGHISQIADATSTTENEFQHYNSTGNLYPIGDTSTMLPNLPPSLPPHSHRPCPLSNEGGMVGTHHQPKQPIHVATSPKKLSPPRELCDSRLLEFNEENELCIDKEFNRHMLLESNNSSGSTSSLEDKDKTAINGKGARGKGGKVKGQNSKTAGSNDVKRSSGEKTRVGNREIVVRNLAQAYKRGRGRPPLTADEKQRRKELREMGLLKRSHRRTKEEVLQWKAEKVRAPAKRGRKPGTGKKNMIKGATGKIILVTVDLSKYENGEVFFQKGFCQAYKGVSKCLECNVVGVGEFPASRYCRFLEFRKLQVIDKLEGTVRVEGFAMFDDAAVDDLVPWTPLKTGYSGMDYDSAIYILSKAAKKFLSVIHEEAKCISDDEVLPVWKCAVKGVRELCDTCQTTIFNLHWVCRHCGFTICPTCYHQACPKHDGNEAVSSWHTPWPQCSVNQQSHSPYQLHISQIVPGNVMSEVLCSLLEICHTHSIQVSTPSPAIRKLVSLLNLQPVSISTSQQDIPSNGCGYEFDTPVIKTLGESSSFLELPHSCNGSDEELLLPPPVDSPHLWICDGDILYLMDHTHSANLSAFQWSWRHSLPIVVGGVHRSMQERLWKPASFAEDFGDELVDLIDCSVGSVIHQIPSKTFWNGFEDVNARLTDPQQNTPRLLKLKDWPTGEDFCDKLPERYTDLMQALPLPEYTRRDGRYNMVASLPDFFVKPDLGPKMYNAYGTTTLPQCGTTNLHLDVSDAVNVMVYASIPVLSKESEEDLMAVIQRECCPKTVQRIMMQKATIGALWHIYSPSDNTKIRNFLSKVLEEKGQTTSYPGTDPIHDQLIYMDSNLRQRLWQEEGVRGWAIAQCVGDAIFIPAGAPHQVQNLSSCIKVAEDFVSPEHIDQCLKLTDEFRLLSDNHYNHEDKLQIKNILYHSVKDIVGTLRAVK